MSSSKEKILTQLLKELISESSSIDSLEVKINFKDSKGEGRVPIVREKEHKDHSVKSELVGIVSLISSSTQKAFKLVDDRVQKGDVLCTIESMKVVTEVKSPFNGVLGSIFVHEGDMVEYGQKLFKIN